MDVCVLLCFLPLFGALAVTTYFKFDILVKVFVIPLALHTAALMNLFGFFRGGQPAINMSYRKADISISDSMK